MKYLHRGIREYRKRIRPQYKETFTQLALGQEPDTLIVSCSDPRVAPHIFASTNPGDVFGIQNPGNFVGAWDEQSKSSEIATVEYAIRKLKVKHIVICGHSDCSAMAQLDAAEPDLPPSYVRWLEGAKAIQEKWKQGEGLNPNLTPRDQLSQVNVIQQIEYLKTYPSVQEALTTNAIHLHGWWFDVRNLDLYELDPTNKKFTLFAEESDLGVRAIHELTL